MEATQARTYFQAIQVRPQPATATRGRRTVAYTGHGRVSLPYDYALSEEGNAQAVVRAYIEQHFQPVEGGAWVMASTPTGYVSVWCPRDAVVGEVL